MATHANMRALVLLLVFISLHLQSHADFIQLPALKASLSGSRVALSSINLDDRTTHTWKSDGYNSISEISNSDGVIAFFDEEGGTVHLHAVAFDPGDRKWHTWESSGADSFSDLANSGGVISCIVEGKQILAVVYDPGDRSWHKWTSTSFDAIDEFSHDEGIVAALANSGQYATGAAYDSEDHSWASWKTGSSSTTDQTDLTNSGGIVAFLSAGKAIAKAFDPGDHNWHSWTDSSASDKNLASSGGIVAFSKDTYIYALAYNADEHRWDKWSNNTKNEITAVTIGNGLVSYTYGNMTYNHAMPTKPESNFSAVRTANKDSLFVQFVDQSFGDITSWQWTFGDGGTSTKRAPTHLFAKPGTFNVTLRVSGPGGSNSDTNSVTVTTSTYTLSYSVGSNGTLKGTSPQTVKFGASGTTVTAAANAGYHFVAWSDLSKANPRRDTNVKTNITARASFAVNQYTINFKTDGTPGATLTGTCCQTISHGLSCTGIKAVAPKNWKFSRWQKGLAIYSTANPLVVTNVTSNMTLSANFARANAAADWAYYK